MIVAGGVIPKPLGHISYKRLLLSLLSQHHRPSLYFTYISAGFTVNGSIPDVVTTNGEIDWSLEHYNASYFPEALNAPTQGSS